MEQLNEIEAAIRLSRNMGVGAVQFKKLIEKYKIPTVALKAWQENIAKINLNKTSLSKNFIANQIEKTIEALKENKIKAYYYSQVDYPYQLNILTEPPPIIYLSSKLKKMPLAAVVGSRKTNELQIENVREITKDLIRKGYGIVSGGALGVDKAAHEVALSENAYTIAVLANGLDFYYPSKNKGLLESIKEKGTLISELMIGALPQKSFFPTRNRLIAALADVVVALPSNESVGTLITAKWAMKLGKRLIYK